MRRFLVAIVPACLAFTGCPAGVNGEVDGDSVPTLFSAFFVQNELDFGEEKVTVVSGIGVSLLDGCNVVTRRQENTNTAKEDFLDAIDGETDPNAIEDAQVDFTTALVEYDEKNLPSDYWTVGIAVNALDDGDIDGAESDIDLEKPDPDQDVRSDVTVCRVNDHPQEDDGVFEADADCWVGLEGTVTVQKWEDENTFQVVADVTLAEQDDLDNDVGDVVLTINAGYCAPLQDALDDAEQIEEDAARP